MAEQPRRELASADPTQGAQDATLQEPGLSSEVSLCTRGRLQHFQCATPSCLCPNTSKPSRRGYEHVARGGRGSLKLASLSPIAWSIRQRDRAIQRSAT